MSLDLRSQPGAVLGGIGILFGAVALLAALVHLFAGPFAPEPDAVATVEQLAEELRATAERALTGAPPLAAEPATWDTDRLLNAAAGVLAGLAIVFGLTGFVRRESARAALSAIALGAGTIALHFFG